MKKIWVIEQGEYSDYSVVGVFSSKENAERVAKIITVGCYRDYAGVSEWTLDPHIDELNEGKQVYHIIMDFTGNVERCCLSEDGWEAGHMRVWKRTTTGAYKSQNINDAITARVWATDDRHAVKIVNEFRIQAIASNQLKAYGDTP